MIHRICILVLLFIACLCASADTSHGCAGGLPEDSLAAYYRSGYVCMENPSVMMQFAEYELVHGKGRSCGLAVSYMSVDQHGDSIRLSGKIYIPRKVRAKNIILLPHYTISSLQEAPSACDPVEAIMLRNEGYILLMPDYIGYGASADRVHPYLRLDVTARNCVDMLLSAKPFLHQLDCLPESDSLIIVGYSQGAQTAIGCLKLLETEYPNLPIKKCYAGSGPHDVGATYDVSIANDKTGMPLTVPMLIMGTSEAYDLDLRREDFFSPLLQEHYDEWIGSKKHSIISLHFKIGSGRISRLMTQEGMDKTQPQTRRMYEGFVKSSIVHVSEKDTLFGTWAPHTPVYLFHSMNDDIVPFANAEHLRMMFDANGTEKVEYDFGRYGGHAVCVLKYLRKVRRMLREC